MNHYVYEITNLVNGKKYIGKRSCKCPIEEDKYMGSGIAITRSIKKYGKDNFGENRYKIVTAKNSFHGRTLATLAATGQPGTAIQKNYDPFIPGITYADFNDLASFEAACDEDTIAIIKVKVALYLQRRISLSDLENCVMRKTCCCCLMKSRQAGAEPVV